MYKKVMVPVDLTHADRLDKAITTAADLTKHYAIPACLVGVTEETPTEIARNPQEFAQKLKDFGRRQSEKHGVQFETAAFPSHDPGTDLGDTLIAASKQIGADLIVMASHVPGVAEHIFASHAGGVASHAAASVFVIR